MKTKDLKQSNAREISKMDFTDHVAGTTRCSCSTCQSSIRQTVGNASSIRFRSARMFGHEKNNTFSVLSKSWRRRSSLMGQFRQHERRSHCTATQPIFVRFANPLRSITSPIKKAITPQPKRHSLNLARGWANGEVPIVSKCHCEPNSSRASPTFAARNVRLVHCSSKKPKTWSVMPAGYIEPRKIVFHRQRVPHQTCGMNWRQELPEDSQILPRNPSRPSASSKNFLQPQQ